MLGHPRRVRGFQKAGFTKRIRVGGDPRRRAVRQVIGRDLVQF
jgi:hypothetical protein